MIFKSEFCGFFFFFWTLAFLFCIVFFFCPWALQAFCKNWVGWESKREQPGWGFWYLSNNLRGPLGMLGSHFLTGTCYHLSYSHCPRKPLRGYPCLRGQLSRSSCGIWWAAFHRLPASVVEWQFVFDFNKGPLHCGAAGSGRPRSCCCAKKSLSPDRAEVGTADNGSLRLSRNHYMTEEEAATVLNPISGADGLSGTGCLSLNQQLRITFLY